MRNLQLEKDELEKGKLSHSIPGAVKMKVVLCKAPLMLLLNGNN